MKKLVLVATFGAALIATGCETTSSRPYTPSTNNIVQMKDALGASGTTVGLGSFTAAEGVDEELTCRAMGAIDVASGKSPTQFIEEAFKTEMFEAGVYSTNSANKISGKLTQFEADSWGTGKWNVGLMLTSDKYPQGYEVKTEYDFKSSFSALSACQNVVDAFTPTVQQLIADAISHSDFDKLAK
ncbi:hypothetical protein ACJ3XI_01730 [Litorimonas sp. RW-G-Af-16]|uniref:hypothetical protein n=1 Tax=Litorimonas sp. RW-G-Af-16 TaxID=3241168 RepID=UPI00390CB9D6